MESSTVNSDAAILYISFILILIACLVGLVGNAIVIFVTLFKMKDYKCKIWFLNLAMADFAFLVCVPLDAIDLFRGTWNFGLQLCKLNSFLYICNLISSILIIMALNIDRALSIAKPMWHMRFYSQNISFWTCTCIWALALASSIPVYFSSGEYKISGKTHCLPFKTMYLYLSDESEKGHNTSREIAALDKIHNISGEIGSIAPYDSEGFPNPHTHCGLEQCCSSRETIEKLQEIRFLGDVFIICFLVLTYIIPLCVILFSNAMMAWQVRKSQTVHSRRLYRITVMVVLVYFLSWTPLASSYVGLLVAEYNENSELLHSMHKHIPLLISISYLNSCLNPMIYVLVSRRIRRQIIDVIEMVWHRISLYSINKVVVETNE
ncbi:hypothetical protein XELAEV_18046573mg [Xenopus laevis]|uniref:G-protein coupled receptors family 1 profile domain-containing protein n=1 Tax=Xenopus laevis TaxID=8355 RepID=A0A974BT71_XENLA|nr:hypothetical protein XELAEV_18046573mg [Xenopus laevis]